MKIGALFTLLTLLAALVLVPTATVARADEAVAVTDAAATDVTADPDTKWGFWAAVGCGIMVRATIYTGGTQAGTIVGAVACCGYMIFDALVVDPH